MTHSNQQPLESPTQTPGDARLRHTVLKTPIMPPYPTDCSEIIFGMGCFWGAERIFWQLEGVYTTAVGYAGGSLKDPDYEQVCTGKTGHSEVVRVVFNPQVINLEPLLEIFWTLHDPTQYMRQGNDVGSQYRSCIYSFDTKQLGTITNSAKSYQLDLESRGHGLITTEIKTISNFFFAEKYHQQYLDKHPDGYCCVSGTGIPYGCHKK